jgi:hypothetical protein
MVSNVSKNMKAKELRIGNLMIKLGKQINISIPDLMFIEGGKYAYHYKPIPLTEEWLIRFGFSIYDCTVKYYYLSSGIFKRIKYDEKQNTYSWNKVNIKFVHQLQNLFYSINGKELELR